MSVLRLSAGGVSFRHRPCVAGHGPGIQVVTDGSHSVRSPIVVYGGGDEFTTPSA